MTEKSWLPSGARPDRQSEVSSCNREAHDRVVQGVIRQAAAEYTPTHAAAKERQRIQTINVKSTTDITDD